MRCDQSRHSPNIGDVPSLREGLFVESVRTRNGGGFYKFWCALCDGINTSIRLPDDSGGVRIPGVAGTRGGRGRREAARDAALFTMAAV